MNIEETKEFLRGYKRLKQKIKLLEDEIRELNEISIGGYSTEEKVQKTSKIDTIGEAIARKEKEKEKLTETIEECFHKREEIKSKLDKMEDLLNREILVRRYIVGERFETISEKIRCSYRWTLTLHKNALKELSQILEKDFTSNH